MWLRSGRGRGSLWWCTGNCKLKFPPPNPQQLPCPRSPAGALGQGWQESCLSFCLPPANVVLPGLCLPALSAAGCFPEERSRTVLCCFQLDLKVWVTFLLQEMLKDEVKWKSFKIFPHIGPCLTATLKSNLNQKEPAGCPVLSRVCRP